MIISSASYSMTSYPSATSQASSRQAGSAQAGGKLSPEEQAQVDKLKARDQQVRQHEQAHLAASGGLATSGASYTYQKGPDGVNYAIGGEVNINTSPGRTPEETIRRAETIRAAALAPADPSGQDRAVAASAEKMAQEARSELAQQSTATPGKGEDSPTADTQKSELERLYNGAAPRSGNLLNAFA
ncbi:MAG: hypothetical protein D3M94_03815 [Rhodocyclales bacterium GT-UBC]|nr:MAG: hypothetical protein D3M94_03815 [Rhodocyclales bacterium GT-UBC]